MVRLGQGQWYGRASSLEDARVFEFGRPGRLGDHLFSPWAQISITPLAPPGGCDVILPPFLP